MIRPVWYHYINLDSDSEIIELINIEDCESEEEDVKKDKDVKYQFASSSSVNLSGLFVKISYWSDIPSLFHPELTIPPPKWV